MKPTEIAAALAALAMTCQAQDKVPFPDRPAPVSAPTVEQIDAKIEDLQRQLEALEQDSNQYRREILEKLHQLAAQDAESRSQELAILSARREREKLWDKLTQDFYRTP